LFGEFIEVTYNVMSFMQVTCTDHVRVGQPTEDEHERTVKCSNESFIMAIRNLSVLEVGCTVKCSNESFMTAIRNLSVLELGCTVKCNVTLPGERLA
jgi:hypothetical protein